MKKASLIVILLLAFALPASSADKPDQAVVTAAEKMLSTMPADFYQADLAAAQQQVGNAETFILDVRETKEMASGRIAGSVNIPIRELPKLVAKLPENKETPILTYCKLGYRGGMAVAILRMWGYTNVRTIKGGLEAWGKAGLPIVEKSS